VTEDTTVDGAVEICDRRRDVLRAGGEHHGPCDEGLVSDGAHEAVALLALERLDPPHPHRRPLARGLITGPREQFGPWDALGIARAVVRAGDPERAAAPVLDHHDPAQVAREIDRGGEAAGSRPDHDAVQRWSLGSVQDRCLLTQR